MEKDEKRKGPEGPCRPLTEAEITLVAGNFSGPRRLRDRALFLAGCRSGFRISELLSLRLRDVWQHGRMVERVTVAAGAMKGGERSRSVLLNDEAAAALADWIHGIPGKSYKSLGTSNPDALLFDFKHVRARKILKDAFAANELTGTLSTHSMRKSYARGVHALLGNDIVKTQRAMGHANLDSTSKYLQSFDQEEIDNAVRRLGKKVTPSGNNPA